MKKLLSALFALCLLPLMAQAGESSHESALDRIIRTGVIRCGYYVFPPITYRDVNTNAISGFSVDMMNRLADRAALKVEWVEEVTFGNWVPAMQANRFDMVCTPMWPELTQARAVLFTHPMFFAGISPLVRADDNRFSDETPVARINQPDITIAIQEGNANGTMARSGFPDAKFYALAAEIDTGSFYQTLFTNKADVYISDRNGLAEINKASEQKLRIIDANHPIKVQSFPLVVNRGEPELRDFLNLAIDEMNYSGEIDHILRKWESEPGLTYLRVAQPFQPVQ